MGIDAEMFVRTKEQVTKEQVLNWAYEIGSAFGSKRFFGIRPDQGWGDPRHHLVIIDEYHQDGPSIFPDEGETFIRVYLWTQYYGPEYERGDLPLIINVARWLEEKIPSAEVWYGGDSSGVLAKPFGVAEREGLWKHFIAVGHAPYSDYFDRTDGVKAPICDMCDKALRCNGWGQNWRLFYCSGCGRELETRDGGTTYQARDKKGE